MIIDKSWKCFFKGVWCLWFENKINIERGFWEMDILLGVGILVLVLVIMMLFLKYVLYGK